jgi:hypothetical protein
MKSYRILFTALVIVFAVPATCPAINFLVDSGFITRDPQTGLTWLDVTNSTNVSFDFVSANFGPGGFYEGFRYASEDEVFTMLAHGGIFNYPYFQQPVIDATFNDINSVLDMVGVVTETNTGSFLRRTTNGLTSTQGTTSQERRGVTIETVDFVSDLMADLASYSGTTFQRSFASPGLGSWLIGTGSPGSGEAEQVPIPPSSTGGGGQKEFDDVGGGGFWFDPPASEMVFATDGNSLFTQVGMPSDFPDIDGMYVLIDEMNGTTVDLMAGEFYEFPTAVLEFTISGIEVDPSAGDPVFAAYLRFDQEMVDFTITPVPEPGLLALLALPLLCLYTSTRRR